MKHAISTNTIIRKQTGTQPHKRIVRKVARHTGELGEEFGVERRDRGRQSGEAVDGEHFRKRGQELLLVGELAQQESKRRSLHALLAHDAPQPQWLPHPLPQHLSINTCNTRIFMRLSTHFQFSKLCNPCMLSRTKLGRPGAS